MRAITGLLLLVIALSLVAIRGDERRPLQWGVYQIFWHRQDYGARLATVVDRVGATPDYVRELTYHDRRTLHNFKYFTWVEQQGRSVEELRQLWDRDFWTETFAVAEAWDRRIEEFNDRVGLL